MSYEPKKIVHGFNIRENLSLHVNFKYYDECISPSSLTLALHHSDPSGPSGPSNNKNHCISPVSSVESLNTYGTYGTYDTCKSAPICIPKKHKNKKY